MEEAKFILIEETEEPNYNMVINGQPQMQKGIALNCPKCKGRLFFFFTQKTLEESMVEVYNYFDKIKDKLVDVKYCSKCGQKILFPTIEDGEVVKGEE